MLVVAPTPPLAANLVEWLTEAGHEVILVTSFLAGKARLEIAPSVLIAEVRLGDYNGLHLALRAKAGNIPALVLGQPGPGARTRGRATRRPVSPTPAEPFSSFECA